MENRKPIKRSKELVSLSRDHHDELLLCWKIRTGVENGVASGRIIKYVLHFFNSNLNHHFDSEERFVFTLLPRENELRIKAEWQHEQLKKLIGILYQNTPKDEIALNDFNKLLEEHIRFEERTLFPAIEQYADESQLTNACKNIDENANTKELTWEDTFWIKNK